MYMFIHVYMCVYAHVHVYICMNTYISRMYTYMYAFLDMHIHAFAYIYIFEYVCIFSIYMHTKTWLTNRLEQVVEHTAAPHTHYNANRNLDQNRQKFVTRRPLRARRFDTQQSHIHTHIIEIQTLIKIINIHKIRAKKLICACTMNIQQSHISP